MAVRLQEQGFVRALWGAALLMAAPMVTTLVFGHSHPGLASFFLCAASFGAALVAVFAVLVTGRETERLRLAWWFIAMSQCDIFAGDLANVFFNGAICDTLFPAKAYVFYLVGYGCLLVGILLLPGNPLTRFERTNIWTGLGMTATGGVLFFWNFVFGPILQEADAVSSETMAIFAYAVFDLMLFWALARLFLRRLSLARKGPVLLLSVATGVLIVTDFIFMQRLQLGADFSLPLIGLGWQASRLLFLVAALVQASEFGGEPVGAPVVAPASEGVAEMARRFSGPVGLGSSSLPFVWLAGACALAYWAARHPSPMPMEALVVGVIGIIVLAMIRQFAVFRENGALNRKWAAELHARENAEFALRRSHEGLELRVQERTAELAAANLELQQAIAARTAAAKALEEQQLQLQHRLAIEALVADQSHRFVNVAPAAVDAEIEAALAAMGRFLDADRGFIDLHREAGTRFDRAYEWHVPECPGRRAQLQNQPLAAFTWAVRELEDQGHIMFAAVDRLPPEAAVEQRAWQQDGILSQVGVPLHSGGQLAGCLAFSAERAERNWNADDIRLLKLMGERLIGALDHKREEMALRDSEERFRGLIETIPHGVQELDAHGVIQFCNPAHERIFGWSAAETVGKTLFDFMADAAERGRLQSLLLQLAENTGPIPAVVAENLTKDGGRIWVRMDCSYRRDGTGRVTGFISIITDITDQHRMEERLRQTQKQESLSVMAGAIAHNFNNLLMAIQGNAEVGLGVTSEPAQVKQHLENIISAAGRAAELSHQMLTYAGSSFAEYRLIDLTALVQESTEMIRSAVTVNCVLQCQLAEPLPRLQGNASQLRQALINLVTNASEAIGHQAGTVTVETGLAELEADDFQGFPVAEHPRPGRYVFLRVRDTGSGIAPESLKRIFDPFFSTKFTGRGLGLAVVRGTVCGHSGCINVTTGPEGAVFTLYFPARELVPPAAPLRPPSPPAAAAAVPETVRGKTILVADDEADILVLLRHILERQGHRVLLAKDGQEAVELFTPAAATVDLVILDLTMPRLTGMQAYEQIHALNPATPVLLASGYSEDQIRQNYPGLQVSAILEKPFNIKTLLDRVAEALATR